MHIYQNIKLYTLNIGNIMKSITSNMLVKKNKEQCGFQFWFFLILYYF